MNSEIEFRYPYLDKEGNVQIALAVDYKRNIQEGNDEYLGPDEPNVSNYIFNSMKIFLMMEYAKRKNKEDIEILFSEELIIKESLAILEELEEKLYCSSIDSNYFEENKGSINELCEKVVSYYRELFARR